MSAMTVPLVPAGRRGATEGYPNGVETRERLLAAANEVFGKRGFDGASTREIAARAGVKSPALGYYFGDKRGLYMAYVKMVTDKVHSRLGPLIAEASRSAACGAAIPALIDCYCRTQDGLLDFFYAPGEGDSVKALICHSEPAVREFGAGMTERVSRPLYEAHAAIMSRILDRPADDTLTDINVVAVNGIFMNFYLNWPSPSSPTVWNPRDPGNMDVLKGALRGQAAMVLEGLSRQAGTWVQSRSD